MKKVFITGVVGFIGANLVLRLLKENHDIRIIGIDNVNDYYDVSLKEYRLAQIEKAVIANPNARWGFIKGDIADKDLIDKIFTEYKPDVVVKMPFDAYGEISDYAKAREIAEVGRSLMREALDRYEKL